jgi:hypothetical protein
VKGRQGDARSEGPQRRARQVVRRHPARAKVIGRVGTVTAARGLQLDPPAERHGRLATVRRTKIRTLLHLFGRKRSR